MAAMCPYCNAEMKQGYIRVFGEVLAWTPENVKKGRMHMRGYVASEEVKLASYSTLDGCNVNAWLCPHCQKVVIDLPAN